MIYNKEIENLKCCANCEFIGGLLENCELFICYCDGYENVRYTNPSSICEDWAFDNLTKEQRKT